MKAYYGRLLRVNLTEMTSKVEKIPEKVFRKYLGGKGLGSYLLLENVAPGIEPLGPENKLIFTTGLASGTSMVGSSRYGIYTKSPATGLYSESYSGGKVAGQIHATGYDAVIIEGVAKAPVFLEISDEQIKFHDALHLWGRNTYETEDAVLAAVNVPGAQAAVIGPAGERLVTFACVENNYWRSAGRTGVGAVMGSKKLKAVVFHGKQKVEIAHPELLKELIRELVAKGKNNPGVKGYQKYGTAAGVASNNNAKTFPTRYWSEGSFEKWENISGDVLLENFQVKNTPCPKCFLACAKKVTVKEGPHQGLTIEGPEYETLYVFGGLCCIDRLDKIIYFNDICDRLGMDTMSAGNLVGLVMEANARGREIPIKLTYGDAEGIGKLLEDMAYCRGPAATLAQGIKEVSREWGLEDLAIHCKGLEPSGYDPRRLKGMGLAYATSTRGACHLRATIYKAELSGIIDRNQIEGKAEVFIDWENRLTIFNTGILCVFFRDLIQWPELQRLIKAVTGWEFTKEELYVIANRIVTATRIFNAREGAKKSDDILPPRFYQESINDGEDCITAEELKYMVDDYYSLRGWDDDGFPKTVEKVPL
ncbi:MAG: aldehyde ferredoxin oxidoreductase family protein [Bacillota bacterium]|jgi:aldehyde:ferredoxin oxidoreductase